MSLVDLVSNLKNIPRSDLYHPWMRIKELIEEIPPRDFLPIMNELIAVEPFMISFVNPNDQTDEMIEHVLSKNGNGIIYAHSRYLTLDNIRKAINVPGINNRPLVERTDGLGYLDEGIDHDCHLVYWLKEISVEDIPDLAPLIPPRTEEQDSSQRISDFLHARNQKYGKVVYIDEPYWGLNRCAEFMLEMVKKDGRYLFAANVQTLDICVAACLDCPRMLIHVHDDFQEDVKRALECAKQLI